MDKVSKERVNAELGLMLQAPSVFIAFSNLNRYNIFPYIIRMPEKCKELNYDGTLVKKCFERSYVFAEVLEKTLRIRDQDKDEYMFTKHLQTGFPNEQIRFFLNLGAIVLPFNSYKVEVGKK